jgi:hypothetical protein
MDTSGTAKIDITKVPFSKYGSNLALSFNAAEQFFTLHYARRPFGKDLLFKLTFLQPIDSAALVITSFPYMVDIGGLTGHAQIHLRGDDAIVIDSHGLDMQLKMLDGSVSWGYTSENYPTAYGIQIGENRFRMIRVDARIYAAIDVHRGDATSNGPFEKNSQGGEVDRGTILEIRCAQQSALVMLQVSWEEAILDYVMPNPAREIETVRRHWERFFQQIPAVPQDRQEIAFMSWYNLWSSFVRAEDSFKYDAMLMSKNYMCSVWSWDHCFNALALAHADKEKALQQYLLPFEVQADSGVLPDYFNPGQEIVWGVTKPPVHGWCLDKLLDGLAVDRDTLQKLYIGLKKWTNWWMIYRDSDGDGIPEYPQGCDSGQDNATIYDIGYFIEAPDLSAFLILQMHTLARLSGLLEDKESAAEWRTRADELYTRLLEHSWDGERFIAKLSRSHKYDPQATALANLMPIVLGEHLDPGIMAKLVSALERDFVTENGIATEALSSARYESDSYWRGPIWAPTTYIIVDGLARGGYKSLAKKIACNFCNMIRDKARGNYENFDALTGMGLRSPGYSWTASVHLLLIHEYLME